MMHRHEFEREMKADVGKFVETLQATVSTSDQAYLASAMSLQAAAGSSSASTIASSTSGLVTSQDTVIARNQLLPKSLGFAATGNGTLRLEPTTFEDQKKRFLDHLHELRRINEGDDNTDAPGYALNLVRLPISVLPGSCTQTGYGAECTISATPHLPPDLLPQTFRNLVVNDLLGLATVPLTHAIETIDACRLKTELDAFEAEDAFNKANPHLENIRGAQRQVYTTMAQYAIASNTSSQRRIDQVPLPTSQVITTFGAHNLGWLVYQLKPAISNHLACAGRAYHLDVQNILRNEISAAYSLLSAPTASHLWLSCSHDLVEAIRTQNIHQLIAIQEKFFDEVAALGRQTTYTLPNVPLRRSLTSILAWCIVVDSALLTDRFLQDMRRTHDDKGCACGPDGWAPLYMPLPPPEVCQQFNRYVACRWPVRVFALDPVTDDQNVADSYSMRRETQLALSMAFVGGNISAGSFSRYARRIEQDIETIALNRTVVGFSHGDATFGWRFYPRVQTPPIPGNLQVITRDLLIGGYGPGYKLRRERLEPGIRECVALVIMPSFIPGVDFDVVGNWFRLAHPKIKALDLKDALRLSRTVRAIQEHSAEVCDQNRYRPGDGPLVLARLEQLSQRLPLQKQLVDVPFENTHGGFEVLSSGVTDLSPELIGWYGAPGIDPCKDTSIFLVGNNFSVHQTRVVVGGVLLDPNCPAVCSSGTCIPGADGCVACDSSTGGTAQKTSPQDSTAKKSDGTTSPQPSGGNPVAQSALIIVNGGTAAPKSPQNSSDDPEKKKQKQGGSNDAKPPTSMADLDGGVMPASLRRPGASASSSTTVVMAPQTPAEKAPEQPSGAPAEKASTAPKTDTTKPADSSNPATATPDPMAGQKANTTTTQTPHACIYQVELLSRQVMRVIIPKGAQSVNGVVDVHIATPYGISPALSIPLVCNAANCPAKAPATTEPKKNDPSPMPKGTEPAPMPKGTEPAPMPKVAPLPPPQPADAKDKPMNAKPMKQPDKKDTDKKDTPKKEQANPSAQGPMVMPRIELFPLPVAPPPSVDIPILPIPE